MTPETPARDAERRRLLDATLAHVPFEGWTRTAIGMGADDAGMPAGESARLFPGGGREMVAFFISESDRAMTEELGAMDLESMRVRDRIAAAVRIRLTLVADHRAAVMKAVALEARPSGLKALYRTVDAIWRAAGDTATDFNFYTKRFLLAGVYISTLLFWLEDDSPDHEATWRFLDRRIDNVMSIGKLARCRRPFRRRASATAS